MTIRRQQGAAEDSRNLPLAPCRELLRPEGCSEVSFNQALLRFRAVLLAMNAPRGRRVDTMRETAASLGCSLRTVYSWRAAFQEQGFAGLFRAARSDRGKTRAISASDLAWVADVVPRIHRYGDIRRAWEASQLPLSYGAFRYWVHLIRKRLGLSELPYEEAFHGSFL